MRMGPTPYTKVYQASSLERAQQANQDNYLHMAGAKQTMAAHVVEDGGLTAAQARDGVLRALRDRGGAQGTILRALGRSVAGGLQAVLERMVGDGLLRFWESRVNTGKFRWVKLAKRPAVTCYALTDAGRAELGKLDRAPAVEALAALRASRGVRR